MVLTLGVLGHHPQIGRLLIRADALQLLRCLAEPLCVNHPIISMRTVERTMLSMLRCFNALPPTDQDYAETLTAAASAQLSRYAQHLHADSATHPSSSDDVSARIAMQVLDRAVCCSGLGVVRSAVTSLYSNSKRSISESRPQPWPTAVLQMLCSPTDAARDALFNLPSVSESGSATAVILDDLIPACAVPLLDVSLSTGRLAIPELLQTAAATCIQLDSPSLAVILRLAASRSPRIACRGIAVLAHVTWLAGAGAALSRASPVSIASPLPLQHRGDQSVPAGGSPAAVYAAGLPSTQLAPARSEFDDDELVERWNSCAAAFRSASGHAPLTLHFIMGVLGDLACSSAPGVRLSCLRAWRTVAEVASACIDDSTGTSSLVQRGVLATTARQLALLRAVVAPDAVIWRWGGWLDVEVHIESVEQEGGTQPIPNEGSAARVARSIPIDPSAHVRRAAWTTARYAIECTGAAFAHAHLRTLLAPVLLPLLSNEPQGTSQPREPDSLACLLTTVVAWLAALTPSPWATSAQLGRVYPPFHAAFGVGDRVHCRGTCDNDMRADDAVANRGPLPKIDALTFVGVDRSGDSHPPVILYLECVRVLASRGGDVPAPSSLGAALAAAARTGESCLANVRATEFESTTILALWLWMRLLQGIAAAVVEEVSRRGANRPHDAWSNATVSVGLATFRASLDPSSFGNDLLEAMAGVAAIVRADCCKNNDNAGTAFDTVVGSAWTAGGVTIDDPDRTQVAIRGEGSAR